MVVEDGWVAPTLGPLWAHWPREHVLGFPLLVGITIAANREDAFLNDLPRPSLSHHAGALGLTVIDDSGREQRRVDPSPLREEGPTFDLHQRERRRLLVDLSPHFKQLAPGRYRVSLAYAAVWTRTEAAPAELVLRRPDGREADLLGRLAAERGDSWQSWTQLPATRDLLDPAFALSSPLSYLRACRYLCEGPEPLAAIDPALLDPVTGVAAAEAYLLRAELAWARGEGPELGGLAAWLRHHRPDLTWWLEAILCGHSDIAFRRQNR